MEACEPCSRTAEHAAPIRHRRRVPRGDILVERRRMLEHGVHIRHRGDVPVGNIGVEITFPVEYIFPYCRLRTRPTKQWRPR